MGCVGGGVSREQAGKVCERGKRKGEEGREKRGKENMERRGETEIKRKRIRRRGKRNE